MTRARILARTVAAAAAVLLYLFLAFLFFALSGCSTTQTPVPAVLTARCQVPPVERPTFPSESLHKGADIFVQVKTLVADIAARKAYEAELEAANRACSE